MNVSINILFVPHLRHNMPQLLGRKFSRQFFHLPLTGLIVMINFTFLFLCVCVCACMRKLLYMQCTFTVFARIQPFWLPEYQVNLSNSRHTGFLCLLVLLLFASSSFPPFFILLLIFLALFFFSALSS